MLDPITGVGGGSILFALALSGVLGECLRRRAVEAVYGRRWRKYAEKMAEAESKGDHRRYSKYSRKYKKAYRKWWKYYFA